MRSLWSRFRHYASVYAGFVSTSFAKEMSFRVNFLLLILVDVSFYVSSIASVHILFSHTHSLGPWNESQLLFFVAFMLAIDQLHMALISESFWRLSPAIRLGELDFILVKPISALFQTFFRYIRPATTFLTVPVWLHLVYRAAELGFAWYQLLLLPVIVLLATALLFGIEIALASTMFWLGEGQGINFIRIELQGMSRWPEFVYKAWIRRAFTLILPVLMIGSQSSYFLFDPSDPRPLGLLVVATALVWLIAIAIWRAGLRRNESASS